MSTGMIDVLGGSSSAGSTSADVLTGLSGSGGYKSPCVAATTTNVALAGLAAVDGVTPVAGDRILVWMQADPTQNGIYNASSGAWSRAIDCDGKGDLFEGTQVAVANGSTYGGSVFMVSTADPITVGVTALAFSSSSFSPSTYVKKDGTTAFTGGQAFQSTASFTTPGGLLRWLFGRTGAESGVGNAGSDLQLSSYDDAGTVIGYVWKAIRSTRVLDLFALPTIGGASLISSLPVAVASGASHAKGLVPDPGATAGTSKFLREDMTFANVPSPDGVFRALKVAVTSNTDISVTADMVTVWDASFGVQNLRSFSQSIATGTSGAGGLDTGSIANNSWYSVWAIAKSDGTMSAIISLSATSPTMPTGYTFKARVGWVRYVSGGLARTQQYGRKARYIVVSGSQTPNLPIMASGAAGNMTTPIWSAVAWANYAPSTIESIAISLGGPNIAGGNILAPNNSYGGAASTSNPAPVQTYGSNYSYPAVVTADIIPESANLYWASAASGFLLCRGWEDNL